jgi:hypothetical protein
MRPVVFGFLILRLQSVAVKNAASNPNGLGGSGACPELCGLKAIFALEMGLAVKTFCKQSAFFRGILAFVKGFRVGGFLAVVAAAVFVSSSAYAACISPAGIAGDIIYGSNNIMAYCNGTHWIGMGGTTSFGTLTTGNFCTTDGSTVFCTTPYINLTSQVTGTLPLAQGGIINYEERLTRNGKRGCEPGLRTRVNRM